LPEKLERMESLVSMVNMDPKETLVKTVKLEV